jgi:hypothetical protein
LYEITNPTVPGFVERLLSLAADMVTDPQQILFDIFQPG